MPIDFDALAERITPDQLAAAIGAERSGTGWRCPSPDHADRDPSFSIFRDGDRTAARCHGRGCELRGSPVQVAAEVWGVPQPKAAERLAQAIGMSNGAAPAAGRRIVATYGYHDAGGGLLFQVVRYHPKDFRQRRPNGRGGWLNNVRGVERVPYRLPELLEAVEAGRVVYVVEGEKDADALAAAGLDATCNAGGAAKWRPEYTEHLRGARVVILPDNDEAGRQHAEQVAEAAHGTAAEVRVLELPALPDGGDVSDWLHAGGTAGELERLAAAVPEWTPDATEPERRSRTMREVLANAGAESLPIAVLPRLAYAGRAGLLAGREKGGKSTLLSAAVAAGTRGRVFLGEPTGPASVLWLTAEERPDDVARRLAEFDADPDRVSIMGGPFEHVMQELRAEVELLRPDAVIVDTLATLVRTLPRDDRPAPGDSTVWTPVVMELVELAHHLGAAVVIVHHGRKSDGEYRDSTAIGAAVDFIAEMKEGRTPAERKLSVRGRWSGLEDFAVRLADGEFELVDGTLPLKSRVLLFVTHNPGCSARQLRDGVEGRGSEVDAAREELLTEGRIVNASDDPAVREYWRADRVPDPGHTPHLDPPGTRSGTRVGTGGVSGENPQGHATDTGSASSADAGCVPRRQPMGVPTGHAPGDGHEISPDTPPIEFDRSGRSAVPEDRRCSSCGGGLQSSDPAGGRCATCRRLTPNPRRDDERDV